MLQIKDLVVTIEDKTILKEFSLEINKGELHYLMGKNGAGKSTVGKVLMGHPDYEVVSGEITFKGKNVLEMEADERSREGIFLANQYPIEVPGVNLFNFLRTSYNSGKSEKEQLSIYRFRKFLEPKLELLNISKEFLERNLNEGFSGGEKKKCEILQMAVLEPDLVILDETDSGLDVDSLKEVFHGISKLKELKPEMSMIVITHYNRVSEYLIPDFVHIVKDGKIIKSGDKNIVLEIDQKGYGAI